MGLAAVEDGDVAELAVKRAAPREQHAHRVVGLELQQVEAWNWGGGDVWLVSLGGEANRGLPPCHGIQEHRQGDFPSSRILKFARSSSGASCVELAKGATHGHRKASLLGLAYLQSHVVLTPKGLRELGINEKRANGVGRWWMNVRSARLEIPINRYQLFTNPKRNGLNSGRCLI
ncbi:hypothetical protein Syncc8109_2435 [Synechococcus sp. WH 8109]|nr:hypothetical protein Syncc8109_2435 [Synechococcus sp. WH 8109]